MKKIFAEIADRVVFLLENLKPEGAEIVSLMWAAGWFFPMVLRPNFLSISVLLKNAKDLLPLQGSLCVLAALILWQLTGVILGGYEPGMMASHAEAQRWYRFRQVGLIAAAWVWVTVAYVVGLTPGGVFSWFVALGCAWGMGRVQVLVIEDCIKARKPVSGAALA